MGGKPRRQQQWAPRPSPLAEVALTRPISQDPGLGLVRDPMFWKRFSRAVHLTEEMELEKDPDQISKKSSFDHKDGDDWLVKQRKKKRKCRIICISVTLGVAILLGGAIFLVLFLMAWGKAKRD